MHVQDALACMQEGYVCWVSMHKCMCVHVCACRMHECARASMVCTCVQGACPHGLVNARVHARAVGLSLQVCLRVQGVHVRVHAGFPRVHVNVGFARCVCVCVHPATRPGVSAAEATFPEWVCG